MIKIKTLKLLTNCIASKLQWLAQQQACNNAQSLPKFPQLNELRGLQRILDLEKYSKKESIRVAQLGVSYKTFDLSAEIYIKPFCLNDFFGLLNIEVVRSNSEKKFRKDVFLYFETYFY